MQNKNQLLHSGKTSNVLWLSSTLGLIYVFVYLNYPNFFTWNAASSAVAAYGILQVLSSFAWVACAIFPTLIWRLGAEFTKVKSSVYLAAVLLWPGALAIIHIYLYLASGNAGLAYLVNYPIFIFTDIVAPIIYVQMWRKFRVQKPKATLETNNFMFDSTKAN